MVFNFSKKDFITRLALSQYKTEFVQNVCLKVFYSFGNFLRMFWATVSFCSNFIDSIRKAAYYWLIKSWGKNI